MSASRERWSVILAGGDGVRLSSLTRRLAGDDRPKQFCPVIGGRSLLAQTWDRAGLLLPAERRLVVVTDKHARYFEPALRGLGASQVVRQPEGRGTAAGILYPLLRLAAVDPETSVAFLPSDHHFSDDARFMGHVAAAFDAVEARGNRVLLLGITPDTHETDYGWIEPGALSDERLGLYQVRRFWEKPDPALAALLRERGCFWNSFVMVGRVGAFEALITRALPDLAEAFLALRPALGTSREADVARAVYARLAPCDFSRDVLSACPDLLGLMPVRGVIWSDLGSPERVAQTLARLGRRSVVALAS